MPDIQKITLDMNAGTPEVEVVIGQAQLGVYKCFLWDANAANPVELAHGNNVDQIPDQFTVGQPVAALTQRFLSFEVLIQAPGAGAGQLYSLFIFIRQGGKVVPGGLIQRTGALADVKSIIEFARFV